MSCGRRIGRAAIAASAERAVGSGAAAERWRLRIRGTVQGVGFRPFVHRLASSVGVTGAVGNDGQGVWCEIQGPPARLTELVERLGAELPPLASVRSLEHDRIDPVPDEDGFRIAPSDSSSPPGLGLVPPDVAPCAACLAEVADPGDRRAGYPFTCCTECGPRFTVVRDLPYDRERTSLADFPLCPECDAEYRDPGSRRFHAEATCCPRCGPTLARDTWNAAAPDGAVVDEVGERLRRGEIVALKGVGGYQLLCRADDDDVVLRLRRRKHRDDKPLALLVASVERARGLVELDELAARALVGPEAPIGRAPRRA
ncbi:MAG TPA: acylphosphatase, partial [Acidimicrobiales bacterium]|nr:acylphosphatase [Acidimicrobiales bacterium]